MRVDETLLNYVTNGSTDVVHFGRSYVLPSEIGNTILIKNKQRKPQESDKKLNFINFLNRFDTHTQRFYHWMKWIRKKKFKTKQKKNRQKDVNRIVRSFKVASSAHYMFAHHVAFLKLKKKLQPQHQRQFIHE